jgi:hypothetical protein
LHALKKNPYAKTTSAIHDRGHLINTPRIFGQIMAECALMRRNLLHPDLLAAVGTGVTQPYLRRFTASSAILY